MTLPPPQNRADAEDRVDPKARAGTEDDNLFTALSEQLDDAFVGLDFSRSHFECGEIAELQGDLERALSFYEQAVQSRESAEFLQAMVRVQLGLGRYEQAMATLERILRMNPESPLVRLSLAETQVRLGKTEDAAAHVNCLTAEVNDVEESYYRRLGHLCFSLSLNTKAVRALERAVEFAPAEGPLHLALARAQMRCGHDIKALGYLRQAGLLEPDNSEIKLVEAELLLKLRKPKEAILKFREAASAFAAMRTPPPLPVLLGEADANIEAGQFEEAAALYKKVITLDGSDIRPYLGLAHALTDMGLFQEAAKALESACERHTESHELAFSLGLAYLKISETSKAEAAFVQALKISPQDILARSYLKELWNRKIIN